VHSHSHSRRGFLSKMLGAAWASASLLERAAFVAARARAQSKEPLPTLFDIEKQADGIYAAVARGRALINCNAAIFENEKDLLIVDAHSAPSAVFALVAQIRREVTQKPVRYVVATHVHGDHTQGLAGYRQISPAVDMIGSAKTRSVLAQSGAARLKSAADGAGRSLENLKQRLGQAKTAEEKAWCQEMIRQTGAFQEEMRNVPLELPNVTFDNQLTLHDKAHELHLSFRGRGHTAGDIVVFCPSKKVIASGDLLHSFFPTISDGYPRDWPGTLRSIEELDFQRVIGGHGSVLENRERAGQMRAYLEELLEIVARAKQQGVPLEKLQQTITPASLKTLQGGYGDYLTESVKKHDFRAQLNTPAEVMARGVRDNVTAVFRNFDRT
jgi:cyclase